jgi:hypothetical protein
MESKGVSSAQPIWLKALKIFFWRFIFPVSAGFKDADPLYP